MARFANVAFSDGSLLHGFDQRLKKNQPIVAPNDVKRYFVAPKESGELCLMSCIFGDNRDIFFPKLTEDLHMISFSEIAIRFLKSRGLKPFFCRNEKEARRMSKEFANSNQWACLFSASNTTGEKDFEQFYTENENLDMKKFESLGVIKNSLSFNNNNLDDFEKKIKEMLKNRKWNKLEIIELFNEMIPNFNHKEKGKYLDSKM